MFRFAFLTACLLLASFTAFASDGKAVFEAKKCVKCHTVASQNLETTSKKDPSEIKDLSNVGNEVDEATLKAYLVKEAELNGEMHKVKFRGEDADFDALVQWLLSLKSDS